ncbi:MAG: thioredoxin family protein [Bacteroidota bacterium]|nr:thioredoxin family protein [Bacteroidota bacterium]MDP4211226.1 thioredoxin family protein [Bacteroidota bacterium]MDP4251134.1 thioredoxin family protein [Bacteroidota bacterium]
MPKRFAVLLLLFISFLQLHAQDSSALEWQVSSVKSGNNHQLILKVTIKPGWQLYGPGQDISGTSSMELSFADSSIKAKTPFISESKSVKRNVSLFDNAPFDLYETAATFKVPLNINGTVPAHLLGTLTFFYGQHDEFYSGSYSFTAGLAGGISSGARIRIPSIDLKHPVSPCGDVGTEGKGLLSIFLLGLVGGFIALLTPCVFPLIPLTVSFFTKKAGNQRRGLAHALLYGFFIFLIYILLSVPFHLLDHTDPEVLNNISTNVWLNLSFFVIFVVFAISFFGYFEINLPGSVANSVNSKSGGSTIAGIFFMALTLAIVSFSCTGPILGTLLAGALSNNGGATQLSFGMGGFGLGLALPFAIFALFPGWLTSLPKSGGWLTSVKVVLGFLELAMAVKFLSNADLVQQWGLVKRETFIGFWVLIGLLLTLYLLGRIRFPHDGPVKKFGPVRIGFILLFAVATIYLTPGLTNTAGANLTLISGFPPPLCYSIYKNPVNCEKGVEPLRDYEQALARAKEEHKPLLIDFTGWACVNCRRMEENVWTENEVKMLMRDSFVVVSLYVDERKLLPATEQMVYTTKDHANKNIITVGDKWATFQSENFNSVQQPQYAIISPEEKSLTFTKGYTRKPAEFADWLNCGLKSFKRVGR